MYIHAFILVSEHVQLLPHTLRPMPTLIVAQPIEEVMARNDCRTVRGTVVVRDPNGKLEYELV
jgi:hypothetical protein